MPAQNEPSPAAKARASRPRTSEPAAWVPIRTLAPRHRARVTSHLKQLDAHDRYLRFGYQANDMQIERYVEAIDFERDEVFGIFDSRLELIAVAHLAHIPVEAGVDCPALAEFGVSVLPQARRSQLGARMFDHAILHARNRGVQILVIHALSENAAMLRIAASAGARIIRTGSEAQACLALPQETIASAFDEVLGLHAAEIDFQLKRHARRLTRYWDGVLASAEPSGSDASHHV